MTPAGPSVSSSDLPPPDADHPHAARVDALFHFQELAVAHRWDGAFLHQVRRRGLCGGHGQRNARVRCRLLVIEDEYHPIQPALQRPHFHFAA